MAPTKVQVDAQPENGIFNMIIARRILDTVVALVVVLLFMKAGLASGAEATCLGQWHFELSSPTPDKEAWLSKEISRYYEGGLKVMQFCLIM
jgi:hypothetical protein